MKIITLFSVILLCGKITAFVTHLQRQIIWSPQHHHETCLHQTEAIRDKDLALNTNSITCEHFGVCPGCVTDKNVERIDVIESAKRYFNSPSLRMQREESENDDFFKVVVPSEVTAWRTQAKLAVSKKTKWGRDGCVFGLYERGTHNGKITAINLT